MGIDRESLHLKRELQRAPELAVRSDYENGAGSDQRCGSRISATGNMPVDRFQQSGNPKSRALSQVKPRRKIQAGPKPAASAIRTSCGRLRACIFVMTLARCTSTVRGLMSRS